MSSFEVSKDFSFSSSCLRIEATRSTLWSLLFLLGIAFMETSSASSVDPHLRCCFNLTIWRSFAAFSIVNIFSRSARRSSADEACESSPFRVWISTFCSTTAASSSRLWALVMDMTSFKLFSSFASTTSWPLFWPNSTCSTSHSPSMVSRSDFIPSISRSSWNALWARARKAAMSTGAPCCVVRSLARLLCLVFSKVLSSSFIVSNWFLNDSTSTSFW